MRKIILGISAGILLAFPSGVSAEEPQRDPSFLHGLGKMIDGIVLELPKNMLEGTLDGPPVVGTLLGALGGIARAGQKTVSGFLEMGAGFDPWGAKRD